MLILWLHETVQGTEPQKMQMDKQTDRWKAQSTGRFAELLEKVEARASLGTLRLSSTAPSWDRIWRSRAMPRSRPLRCPHPLHTEPGGTCTLTAPALRRPSRRGPCDSPRDQTGGGAERACERQPTAKRCCQLAPC